VSGNGAKDFAEAVKWYRKAAEQGDEIARYNLGSMYATAMASLGTMRTW